MVLRAKNYIDNGFSFEDAGAIAPVIEDALKQSATVEIDFSGVTCFTTYFFNSAITCLMAELGIEEYEKRIMVSNLPAVDKLTYQCSHDCAIEFYGMTAEQRTVRQKLVDEAFGW